MKIEYENKISDIDAYGRLIYDKSPTVKQHRKKAYNTAVVLIIIFGLVLYFLNESNNILFIWLALSIAWLVYIPFQYKKRYLKNMVKTFEDEQHKNFFGGHSLTTDDTGITDEIESVINHTPWENIEHLELTDTHTFIFVKSVMVYAIPKHSIIDGDYETFIDTLKTKFEEFKKKGNDNENRSAK